MVPLRHITAMVCGLALLHAPARAAVLIDEYALRGSLGDTSGNNALSALGGQITSLGYVFAANQGLAFSNPLFATTNFSVELSFKLDSTVGDGKLIDFQHLTSDPGLYQHNGSLDFAYATSSGTPDFSAGANVQVVLTRDGATNVVVGYVNGQQQFSFEDSKNLAVASTSSPQLIFFADDRLTTQPQAGSGTVNYIRVFNGALTPGEVSALYASGPPSVVPEPETFVLLSFGLATIVFVGRRRKSRR